MEENIHFSATNLGEGRSSMVYTFCIFAVYAAVNMASIMRVNNTSKITSVLEFGSRNSVGPSSIACGIHSY